MKTILVFSPALVMMVLINLFKNASEVLIGIENPRIEVEIGTMGPVISVRDNSSGIPSEIMDEIFVPFFTTKPKGNGIGLSLSKQIMKVHGGDLTVSSSPAATIFRLDFG